MPVPKLRFKEFSNEWKKIKLKYISTELQYGMNAAATDFDGQNKYIRITDIDDNTHLYNNNPVSPDGKLEEKFLVNTNDILFARTGASTGKTYLYSIEDGRLYFAGFLIRAHIKENNNSRFIFEQTNLSRYKNWLKLTSMRSGQPGINSAEYGNYEFSITNIDEENKIAHFFELLNKKIELQQRKIEVLKMYKKGLTKKLLDYSNYKKVKLKDICTFYSGGTPDSKNKNFYTGNIPFIRSGEIHNETTELYITSEAIKNSSAKMVYKGSVLYALYGATSGDVSISKINGAINQAILCINGNNSINNCFLAIYLAFYRNIIINTYLQGGQGNLSADIIKNLIINLPSAEEQTEIVQYINSIDKKLYTENEKLKNLNFLKKYLLQQMFI